MENSVKLVVFLGNPGAQYEKTRHNVAWMFADFLFKTMQGNALSKDTLSKNAANRLTLKIPGNALSKNLLPNNILPIGANWQNKFHGSICKNGNIVFLKPQTFMNQSGISVRETSDFFNIPAKNVIVVHDDIELKLGEIKFQIGGGMGGHNGLRSIKQHLGTDGFARLRIGVGRPDKAEVASWVLGKFGKEEELKLSDVFTVGCTFIL